MPKAIRRIVRKQLDEVLAHLNASGENRDEAIHDARSRFKKVRSLLRLMRGEIGGKVYRRENACYREAGRRLSGLRDAAVVNQTLGQLVKRSSGRVAPADCDEFRRALRALRSQRLASRGEVLAEVAKSIEAARRRVANRLKRLETYLGKHHDLTVLRQWVLSVMMKPRAASKANLLLRLINERQAELQSKARPLGERIYAEKPGVFADRFEEYWQVRHSARR